MTSYTEKFEFYATRIKTKDGHELFSFPIDGKKIFDIATVSHIKRDGTEIEGFQRSAVQAHIKVIAEYVEKSDAMIPNAIVLAISDPDVDFEKIDCQTKAIGEIGILRIPNHLHIDIESETRPAFIVDGQQRTQAIQQAKVSSFPIMVCAFKEGDQEYMAQQFYNVNATKPLPRELIAELLPNLPHVSAKLRPKQMAAELGNQLAFDMRSPFFSIVKSTSNPDSEGFLRLNSIINPIEALINDPTSYLGMQCTNTQFSDIEKIKNVLFNYWDAVKQVFPEAWGIRPQESRLMHGTGMYAMFQLTTIVLRNCSDNPNIDEIVDHIRLIAPHCRWTEVDGDWEDINTLGTNMPWNGFQNTAIDKRNFTAFLTRKYVEGYQRAK